MLPELLADHVPVAMILCMPAVLTSELPLEPQCAAFLMKVYGKIIKNDIL
ncbi:MAG: hypothetical protein K5838_03775 [Elusimicrobiales bacterium]|nr:hypothetical protein [Elusimicrobiales bacterium]